MKNTAFRPDCLREKRILISGGCGSIGAPLARSLVDHGAQLYISDLLPPSQARQKLPTQARYIRSDMTKESSIQKLFDQTGDLDIVLVHAAIGQTIAFVDYPLKEWRELMQVNLEGSFLMAREAVRRMKGKRTKENPGKIIFTTSWIQDIPWPEISAYNASKAALKSLMRSIARECASDHLLVNAMAPGIVSVGLAKHQWKTIKKYRDRAKKAIPLGYMQPPETIANAFLFLCSDASSYMTGSTLLMDGGCSLYPMI